MSRAESFPLHFSRGIYELSTTTISGFGVNELRSICGIIREPSWAYHWRVIGKYGRIIVTHFGELESFPTLFRFLLKL